MPDSILYSYSEDAPKRLSEILLVEINRDWCRENGTLAPTTTDLPMGAVLALNEDGNFVPYLLAAGDSQAVAMLVTPRPKNTAAQKCVVLRRGAKVAASGLVFLDPVTGGQKQTAYSQLTTLGIVVEE